jgi:GNAT superfamily N-acetyltransferase
MDTDYVVRLAGPEHVAQLPDIEREAATRFGDSLPESALSHVTPLDSLAAAQQAGLLWVALEPAGAPVGFAVASIRGRRVHLEELDVLPWHGRKGIGSALVEAIEDYALNRGCAEITLTTFRDVPWNAPFYARVGFEVIPEQELGAELVRRLSDEAALGLERSRRVAMLKPLSRLTSASTPTRRPVR